MAEARPKQQPKAALVNPRAADQFSRSVSVYVRTGETRTLTKGARRPAVVTAGSVAQQPKKRGR